jgi:hypothetical protein
MSAKLPTTENHRKILLVEPSHETFVRLILLLDEAARNEYSMDWATTFRFGTSLLHRNEYDLCLVGTQLGFHTGQEFIEATARIRPELPLILLEKDRANAPDHDIAKPAWDSLDLERLDSQLLFNSLREACSTRSSA